MSKPQPRGVAGCRDSPRLWKTKTMRIALWIVSIVLYIHCEATSNYDNAILYTIPRSLYQSERGREISAF